MALSDSSLSKSLRKASDSTKVTNSGDSTEGMPSDGAAAAAAGAGAASVFFLRSASRIAASLVSSSESPALR